MNFKHPTQTPCAGDRVCIPHTCPIGSVITMQTIVNTTDAAVPTLEEINDDHVIVEFPESGNFQLQFICCPP